MICTTITNMGHPQPTTPLQVDNICTNGIINGTTKQSHYKSTNIRFYWLKDHEFQGQFRIHWHRGTENLSNYFTKNHSAIHHCRICSKYLFRLHHPDFWLEVILKNPAHVFSKGVLIGGSSLHLGSSLPPLGYIFPKSISDHPNMP